MSQSKGPTIQTDSKTNEWWREKAAWKDGKPANIQEFVEGMLGMFPSPGQYEILWTLAGHDPYEWDVTYQQYALGIGQGGGKNTYVIAPFIGYLTYKIANMKDPHAYFSRFYDARIDRQTKFEISNSSLVTERQAKNVHFAKMTSLIRRCMTLDGRDNWFEKYAGIDLRASFGDLKDKSIRIPTVAGCGEIVLHSFDSTPTAPEGLNLIAAIVDEPSRADTQSGYVDAQLLWNVIVGNLNTRFGRNVGKAIAFSYLNNSEWDFMDTLLKQADEEKKQGLRSLIFATKLASWETNPNIKRADESVERAYRNDPSGAKARYECIKGAAKEGFYQPHVETIRESFVELDSPVEYEYKVTERRVENPRTKQVEVKRYIGIDLTAIRGDNRVRCWALDPAEKYDSFILKGGYVETMDERRDELFIDNREELIVMNRRPVIDVVIMWQPQAQEGLSVDYLNIGEVLGVLLGKYPNSKSVNSDKWNMAKLSQEVIARGVASETLAFGNAQQLKLYTKLRWMMWNGIPRIHYDTKHTVAKKGISKTVGEWNVAEHERLLKLNGNKVDHPPDGSKDLADVDAILVSDLASIETENFSAGQAFGALTDEKMIALAERFMVARQELRNASIPAQEHLERLAKLLGVSIRDASTLPEYVNDTFPGF